MAIIMTGSTGAVRINGIDVGDQVRLEVRAELNDSDRDSIFEPSDEPIPHDWWCTTCGIHRAPESGTRCPVCSVVTGVEVRTADRAELERIAALEAIRRERVARRHAPRHALRDVAAEVRELSRLVEREQERERAEWYARLYEAQRVAAPNHDDDDDESDEFDGSVSRVDRC